MVAVSCVAIRAAGNFYINDKPTERWWVNNLWRRRASGNER